MTLINIAALGKKFPLWGEDFLEPFVKIHICTYSMCIFLYEVETFKSLLSQIYTYPNSKCIFIIQGVRKMENAMKWPKNLCICMYRSSFGLINFFWESIYYDLSHIFQFLVHFMTLSIFRTPCMVKIHFE